MDAKSLPSIKFSTAYGITTRKRNDDWFDPFLERDTALFVDPFLIGEDDSKYWAAAHERLLGFFNRLLELLAKSSGDHSSPHWRKVTKLLVFPEPYEFCLGYSKNTIFGHGTSVASAKVMQIGAMDAISAGINHIDHLEDIALFGGGVGADVISDAVCNILKSEFAAYTAKVAKRHGVSLEKLPTRHGSWNQDRMTWIEKKLEMPPNPVYVSRKAGVLLVPERFLRELPALDANEFWIWAYDNVNQTLRDEFNYDIARSADRESIRSLAKKRPDLVKRYMKERKTDAHPYNVRLDPKYLVRWFDDADIAAADIDVTPPPDATHVRSFVQSLCESFKDVVENQGGWELLWVDAKERHESHAQRLFTATITRACREADIDVSPETDVGRGRVDFKFSFGWKKRNYVELKLAGSSSFWRNLDNQLPTYLSAEDVDHGWFVIIQTREAHLKKSFIDKVHAAVREVNKKREIEMMPIFVDATRKKSASQVGT